MQNKHKIWIPSRYVAMIREWLEHHPSVILVYSKTGWAMCDNSVMHYDNLIGAPYIIIKRKHVEGLGRSKVMKTIHRKINSPNVRYNISAEVSNDV